MKWGHVEDHLAASNPATWRWRLRGAMTSDPTVIVIVAVGLNSLITGAVALYLWWRGERLPRRPRR